MTKISIHPEIVRLQRKLSTAPLQAVSHPLLEKSGVELLIKREDLLHPIISGNKWRKLKYILNHALKTGHGHLISMGGSWSNHLHALAWAGKELGLQTSGIIRGESTAEKTQMLREAEDWKMKLIYVNRSEFRRLRKFHQSDSLPAQHYKGYWIPEGGTNKLALNGVAELIDEVDQPFDTIILACGTGTTMAGIAKALSQNPADKKVIGLATLKGASFLNKEIERLAPNLTNWQLNLDYHFGGFAKTNANLLGFIEQFEKITKIELEPVYTGKMMFGLFDLITQGKIVAGQRIIVIHTGGLQGKRGFC